VSPPCGAHKDTPFFKLVQGRYGPGRAKSSIFQGRCFICDKEKILKKSPVADINKFYTFAPAFKSDKNYYN
jgi:hypothetical protein